MKSKELYFQSHELSHIKETMLGIGDLLLKKKMLLWTYNLQKLEKNENSTEQIGNHIVIDYQQYSQDKIHKHK